MALMKAVTTTKSVNVEHKSAYWVLDTISIDLTNGGTATAKVLVYQDQAACKAGAACLNAKTFEIAAGVLDFSALEAQMYDYLLTLNELSGAQKVVA